MGKRKAARKRVTKPKPKLPTTFKCLYCSHEDTVEIRLNFDKSVGTVTCRHCKYQWKTRIHSMYHAIDVYSDWVDALESVQ